MSSHSVYTPENSHGSIYTSNTYGGTLATNLISSAFEDYSQCLRIMLEAHTRAFKYGLIKVDFSEAIGNIDVSLTATLNAFHSIFDAIKKSKLIDLDMYKSAECATLIALRNARHHNKANKIRELHRHHEATHTRLSAIGWYIVVDFPSQDKTATIYDVNISWNDFVNFLESPQAESRLSISTVQLIYAYLNKDAFDKYPDFYGKRYKTTFFNAIPLVINASITLLPHIEKYIKPNSMEAQFFKEHFLGLSPANTTDHDVSAGPFSIPDNWK